MLLLTSIALGCTLAISEARVRDLSIADETPFTIDIKDVAVRVTFAGPNATLHVQAPLAFEVTRPLADWPFRTSKPLILYGGRLSLAQGVAPMLRPNGEDPMPTELPLLGLNATEVRIPCESLALDDALPAVANIDIPQGRHLHAWLDHPAPLYTKPRALDPFLTDYSGPLRVIQQRPGWVHVRANFTDGSVLEGWAAEANVRVEKGNPLYGMMGSGAEKLGYCRRSHGPTFDALHLEAGTPIYSGRNGAQWATVAAPIDVSVFPEDDGWFRVAYVRGLPTAPCEEHERVWVKR